MAKKNKPDLPKILSANDLLRGETVYYTALGTWSAYVTDALIATSPEALETLKKAGSAAFESNQVIDVAIVDVEEGGKVRPARLRELIRASGPTVRPDLNKTTVPAS